MGGKWDGGFLGSNPRKQTFRSAGMMSGSDPILTFLSPGERLERVEMLLFVSPVGASRERQVRTLRTTLQRRNSACSALTQQPQMNLRSTAFLPVG